MGSGEWVGGQCNFLPPLSIPHSLFLTFSSAADSEHFDSASQVVVPSVGLSVVAAEDRASVVLFTVMATESAAPSGLRGDIVSFDCG